MLKLKLNKNRLFVTFVGVLGILVGLSAIQSSQDTRNRAEEPICSNTTAFCRWGSVATATSYGYIITDTTLGTTITRGVTSSNQVSFNSVPNHVYKCSVSAINKCGVGLLKEVTQLCVGTRVGGVESTLTPTQIPSLTPPLTPTTIPFVVTPSTAQTTPVSLSLITSSPVASPKPTIRLNSPSPKPLIGGSTLNKWTTYLSYLFAFLVFISFLFIIFRFKGKRKKTNDGKKKDEKKGVIEVYSLTPYKSAPENKAYWVTLTKKETQTLGLYHGENIEEGTYTINGIFKEADGIPYLDIISAEKKEIK